MRCLLLLVCLALSPLDALAQQPGEATGARDMLLILDCSASMLGVTADGEVKLDAAKRVVIKLIDRLPADLNVGLVAFGHRLQTNDPAT